MILLRDLLARRELGLRAVACCEQADAVAIHGAEVCDLPDPRPWLNAGWMLLTTGVALGHGAHRQRLLVERAAESRAAAIGFGVGLVHEDVPEPIRDGCEQFQIPLLAVPAATPFRLILNLMSEDDDPYRLQETERALSMQTYLLEALSAPEPETELLRRLGSLLSGTALLADEVGTVNGAPNAALPDELWGPLRGAKGVRLLHLRGQRYVTARIGDRDGTRRWLVVVGDASALPDELARSAVQSAERLARLVERARPPRPAEARAVRAELVSALLGWHPAGNRRQLAHRAAALGLGVESPMEVAALRWAGAPAPTREERSQRLARARVELETQLTEAGTPFLLAHHGDDLVLIVPAPLADVLAAPLTELAAVGIALDVGVGRSVATLEDLPRSYADARFSLEQLASAPPADGAPRVLTHAQLDLATALICDADAGRLQARREAMLGGKLDAAQWETLNAYLEHRLDVTRTASSLNLHPNSLRYRLQRIEERLGLVLDEPSTIANLYLAALVERSTRGG